MKRQTDLLRLTHGSEDLGPELDFLRELWALDHALQKASKRMDRALGITGPQRLALRLVSRFPGLPAGRLAGLMHLHPSTVSGIVQRLAARGLLERGAASADRRRAALRLTVRGLEGLGRPHQTIESVVASVLAERPAGERKAALAFLRALASRLEAPPPSALATASPAPGPSGRRAAAGRPRAPAQGSRRGRALP